MILLIFLLILSVLVLVHEFGHFFVAKKLGIKVEEFGLGIPPRVFGKKIGDTIYSINLLPFGGFVRVNGEEVVPGQEAIATADPTNFVSKSPLQRIAVLAAGVFMNLVLAVVLFYIVLFANGFKTQYIPMFFDYKFPFGQEKILGTVVTAIQQKSAADISGVKIGEAVLEIDGIRVNNVYEVRDALKNKLGLEVSVLLIDVRTQPDGPTRIVKMTPLSDDIGNAVLGVYLTKATSVSYLRPAEKLFAGFLHSYNVLFYSVDSLSKLISFSVKEKSITPVSQSVAGPVGIYQLIEGLIKYGGDKIVYTLLDFTALMSISLAFMNILPIPALDGGRILFVVLEKIRGKPVSAKIEANFHRVGFILLLGMLVLVTIKDIFH